MQGVLFNIRKLEPLWTGFQKEPSVLKALTSLMNSDRYLNKKFKNEKDLF